MAGENAQQRSALERSQDPEALDFPDWPRDKFGQPMLRVSVSQGELIPTVQFGNVTLGPVQVVGFIPDGPEEQVKEEMKRFRRICDESLAEDRATLYADMQARIAAGQPAR